MLSYKTHTRNRRVEANHAVGLTVKQCSASEVTLSREFTRTRWMERKTKDETIRSVTPIPILSPRFYNYTPITFSIHETVDMETHDRITDLVALVTTYPARLP